MAETKVSVLVHGLEEVVSPFFGDMQGHPCRGDSALVSQNLKVRPHVFFACFERDAEHGMHAAQGILAYDWAQQST